MTACPHSLGLDSFRVDSHHSPNRTWSPVHIYICVLLLLMIIAHCAPQHVCVVFKNNWHEGANREASQKEDRGNNRIKTWKYDIRGRCLSVVSQSCDDLTKRLWIIFLGFMSNGVWPVRENHSYFQLTESLFNFVVFILHPHRKLKHYHWHLLRSTKPLEEKHPEFWALFTNSPAQFRPVFLSTGPWVHLNAWRLQHVPFEWCGFQGVQ